MAQPTDGTIDDLTRTKTLPGFFPGGWVDQFLRVLPFQEASGYGRFVEGNRSSSLGGVSFYSPGGALTATQGQVTMEPFTFERIAGTAQVDVADIDASADPNQQLELQVAMRKIALLRVLSNELFFGDATPPNMKGLLAHVEAAGQTLDLNDTAPTLARYHRLVSLVRASDGALGTGAAALVMNFNARRQLTSLIEAAGGWACYENDELLGVPVMKFDGVPVYVTEGITVDAVTSQTTVFAVKLRGPTGIRMLHVGGNSAEYGIVVDEVPNQMGVSERAKIVRGYYALLVPEVQSVAAMTEADMTGFLDGDAP